MGEPMVLQGTLQTFLIRFLDEISIINPLFEIWNCPEFHFGPQPSRVTWVHSFPAYYQIPRSVRSSSSGLLEVGFAFTFLDLEARTLLSHSFVRTFGDLCLICKALVNYASLHQCYTNYVLVKEVCRTSSDLTKVTMSMREAPCLGVFTDVHNAWPFQIWGQLLLAAGGDIVVIH